jgi:hypothetical protein
MHLPPSEIDLQNCLRIKVIIELKELFQKQARGERYLKSKTLIVCEMMKYNLVKEHMLILYEYM